MKNFLFKSSLVATSAVGVLVTTNATMSVSQVLPGQTSAQGLRSTMQITGLELVVELDSKSFGPEEPVIIEVTLKNKSSKKYSFIQTLPERDFSFIVKDDKGQTVQLTKYGKLVTGPLDSLGKIGVTIKPDQELRYKFLVSRLYDMSLSGDYSLTVFKSVLRAEDEKIVERGQVASAPIQIHIGERFSPRLSSGLYQLNPVTSQKQEVGSTKKAVGTASSSWKEGDTWPLKVELLTTETQSATPQDKTAPADDIQEPRLIAQYTMQVKVAGTEQVEGGDYWQLDFVPSRDAPASVRDQSYRVLVSKKDGSTVAVVGLRGFGNPDLKKSDNLTFVRDAPLGYPLHIFPLDVQHKLDLSDGSHLELATQATGPQRTLSAKFEPPAATTFKGFTLNQVWSPGQKWWDKYEMIDEQRQLILRATRTDPKP